MPGPPRSDRHRLLKLALMGNPQATPRLNAPEGRLGRLTRGTRRGVEAVGSTLYDLGTAPFTAFAEAYDRQRAQGGVDQREAFDPALTTTMAGALVPGATALPKGAVGIFGGVKARTADHAALQRAKALARDGRSRDEIWTETGWFQGGDKKWRFEIDDSKLAVSGRRFKARTGRGILDGPVRHEMLAAAYPKLKHLYVSAKLTRKGPAETGSSWGNSAVLARGQTNDDLAKTMAHELQHQIQNREGFSHGGSHAHARGLMTIRERWDDSRHNMGLDAHSIYRAFPGEEEARLVSRRRKMTAPERQATPPWESPHVDESDLADIMFNTHPWKAGMEPPGVLKTFVRNIGPGKAALYGYGAIGAYDLLRRKPPRYGGPR